MPVGPPVFEFPAVWGGNIKLDSSSFVSSWKCVVYGCPRSAELASDVVLCTCHKCCQTHCAAAIRDPQMNYIPPSWPFLLLPYVNVAVSDPFNERIIADCARKLNAFDGGGFGMLHQFFQLTKDDGHDVALLKSLLEIGVDPEMRYVPALRASKFQMREPIKEVLGGSAIHFAAHFGRKECIKLLVEVGINLDAETADGKRAEQLCQDEDSMHILEEAKAPGSRKSLAQLAKERKFYAIRYRIRSGRMTHADVNSTCEGKTALQWCLAIVLGEKIEDDVSDNDAAVAALAASHMSLELRYRLGRGSQARGLPLLQYASFGDDEGSAIQPPFLTDSSGEEKLEVVHKKLDLILEMITKQAI